MRKQKKSYRFSPRIRLASGSSTIEYTLFVSAIVACIIIAMDVNTGFFTRALRETLGLTTDSMVEQASYVPKSHGPWEDVLFSSSTLSDFLHSGPGTVSMVNFEGEDVILADSYEHLASSLSDLISIDPDKHYVLSGDFMSIGEEAGNLYFGLIPYDASGDQILSRDARWRGTPGTVQAVSDTEIVVAEELSGWMQESGMAGHRLIGIYFDGDTSHLPDYVVTNYSDNYSLDPTEGAYNSTSGNTIFLNDAIPESIASQIVPGTTVVQNHTNGLSYIYAAANSENPPLDTWTTYTSDVISGTSFNTITQFWPETAYVRVVAMPNYYNTSTSPPPEAEQQMYLKNITFSEVP